ncbi:GNAT family N-acetyltransferase [Leptobacterium sp. I13]|uniref:GNAT family N-acetyltransferase n=1 Tax=Leptobacterium meishanense TaxID=3128904 RepID=UPI0030EBC883
MVDVFEAVSKKEIKTFIKFPFKLYKNNPYWVPPIIKQELDTFDKTKNPAFNNATARFFLAKKQNKIVGRIAVIINWKEVNEQQKKKVRFGWLDMIDDIEVTKALMSKVYEIGKVHQLEYAEGPVGFSNMDKAGMLIHGFDKISNMTTFYNHAYYPEHLKKLDFNDGAHWVEYHFDTPDKLSDKVIKMASLIKQRYQLNVLRFKSIKRLLPYTEAMFDLMNRSYKVLQSFVPIPQEDIPYYKEKYIKFLHPDYVILITDANNELIAFAIMMPSFAKALQKANGKLFPFGFLQLMKAMKKNDTVNFYLIGIAPEYQNKGIPSIIFEEALKKLKEKGVKYAETNPELEENKAVQSLWKHFDPVLVKRWKTFTKEL